MKLVWKIISNTISAVLFLVFILMLFLVISSKAAGGEPQFFGYQLKSVLSGSMEPGIKTGSVIAVKPGGDFTRFKEGDVITFMQDENTLVTHRVTEVNKSGEQVTYTTKGDNNNAADTEPVLSENVVAEYTGVTVPYVGYFVSYAQSKEGSALMLILPGLLLLGYSGFTIFSAIRQLEPKEKAIKKTT
ncbi:signal peptidase I [Siminovitchia acidinfaciens]|uniref:Signal peptidase I n=1 Tax=Siminovitchia acidinfaciens TaxID=2321395 RepID=A0A429XYB4_9BACI|nr:signal peptidase I [Siminovitchia acidinfaciens]RST73732.1 signal peptidase I [Siminovitchia acidinfaciens]